MVGPMTFTAGGVTTDTKWYQVVVEVVGLGGYTKVLSMPEFVGKGQPADSALNPFLVLIGRDILHEFELIYNYPGGSFTLELLKDTVRA